MLPAAARLRRRADFRSTLRRGRRTTRGSVALTLVSAEPASVPSVRGASTSNVGDSPALVGFVVSRSVGGAVTRNLVTRRLRHLVRDHLDRLPAGSRLVIRALPTAATTSYADLDRDFTAALGKLTRDSR